MPQFPPQPSPSVHAYTLQTFVQHAFALHTWPAAQHALLHVVFGHEHVVPEQVSFAAVHVAGHVTLLWQVFGAVVLHLLPHAAALLFGVQHV